MRSKGNGNAEQCAANLLLITRGEVPYERLKGIDARLIDKPSSTVQGLLKADLDWLLTTYEPRVGLDSLAITKTEAAEGQFNLNIDIRK